MNKEFLNFKHVSEKEYKLVSTDPNFSEIFGRGIIKKRIVNAQRVADYVVEQRISEGKSLSVKLEIIKNHTNKVPYESLSWAKDHLTDILFGICVGEMDDGNPRWQRMMIEEYKEMDLNRVADRIFFAMARYNPKIEDSLFGNALGVVPAYKIIDEDIIAVDNLSTAEEMAKALDVLKKLSNKSRDLVNFARYLGINVTSEMRNIDVVKSRVAETLMNDPKRFNKLYNDKLRNVFETFIAAKQIGLIRKEDDTFIYSGNPLGTQDEDAVMLLATKESLLNQLKVQLLQQDDVMKVFTKGNISDVTNSVLGSGNKPESKEILIDPKPDEDPKGGDKEIDDDF